MVSFKLTQPATSHQTQPAVSSPECQTNYHHNFQVKNGVRTYYDGIPSIIQVGEHQFAEKRLVQLWITLMLVSWQVSESNVILYILPTSYFIPQDISYQLRTLIQSLSV
jgi:hypothetical protein